MGWVKRVLGLEKSPPTIPPDSGMTHHEEVDYVMRLLAENDIKFGNQVGMEMLQQQVKKEHPNATDAEVQRTIREMVSESLTRMLFSKLTDQAQSVDIARSIQGLTQKRSNPRGRE